MWEETIILSYFAGWNFVNRFPLKPRLLCCKRKTVEKASLEVKFLLQPYQVFNCDILYLDYVKKSHPLNFICATICDFGNDRQKISEEITGHVFCEMSSDYYQDLTVCTA